MIQTLPEDLAIALRKFESAVESAWIYDTKLGFCEADIGSGQYARASALFDKVSEAKENLISEILKLTA